MKTVKLPRKLVNQLLTMTQDSSDKEICGLIGGSNNKFQQCYSVANIATDKSRFFEMDPKGLVGAMRQIRENNELLVGIYHSHPNSPALPSITDVRQHQYPEVLYLIISLNTKGVLELRGFYIRDNEIEPVAIGI